MNVKNADGFHTYGWMVNDLGLEGGDLIAFALVYAYTKDYAGTYTGRTAYLSAWTGWTEKTSRGHLANLVRRGLIVEAKGGKKDYVLAPGFYEKISVKITEKAGKNYREKTVKITERKGKKLPPIKENVIKENVKNNPPTPQDVADYCRTRGFADPEGFADYYVESMRLAGWTRKNGQPVDNWKQNVLQWEKHHKEEVFAKRHVSVSHTVQNPNEIYQ